MEGVVFLYKKFDYNLNDGIKFEYIINYIKYMGNEYNKIINMLIFGQVYIELQCNSLYNNNSMNLMDIHGLIV